VPAGRRSLQGVPTIRIKVVRASTPSSADQCVEITMDAPDGMCALASPLAIPKQPDQHRPERPILLAVDQQLAESPRLWVPRL
jgi:hypothetical protein